MTERWSGGFVCAFAPPLNPFDFSSGSQNAWGCASEGAGVGDVSSIWGTGAGGSDILDPNYESSAHRLTEGRSAPR